MPTYLWQKKWSCFSAVLLLVWAPLYFSWARPQKEQPARAGVRGPLRSFPILCESGGLEFSPSGKYLLVWGQAKPEGSGVFGIYNTTSGARLAAGETLDFDDLHFLNDDAVWGTDENGDLIVRRWRDQKLLWNNAHLGGNISVFATANDGKSYAAVVGSEHVQSGINIGVIGGRPARLILLGDFSVVDMYLSPDGRTLFLRDDDGRWRCWGLRGPRTRATRVPASLRRIPIALLPFQNLALFEKPLPKSYLEPYQVPGGKVIRVFGPDKYHTAALELVEIPSGKIAHKCVPPAFATTATSRNGCRLAVETENGVAVYRLPDFRKLRVVENGPEVEKMSLSISGRQLAVMSRRKVWLYDVP